MDRKITIKQAIQMVVGFATIFCSSLTLAGFTIVGETDQLTEPHGIAVVDDFTRSIYGEVRTEDEDRQFMSGLTPVRYKDYWFLRAKVAPWGNSQIQSLEIKKADVTPVIKGTSKVADGRPKAYVLDASAGYSWGDFSMELEGLFPKQISYLIPHVTGTTDSIHVKLQSSVALINLEYSFYHLSGIDALAQVVGFHPYIAGAVGVTFHSAQTRILNNAGLVIDRKTHESTSIAGKIGAGLRWKLNESWSWDISYQYAELGKHKIKRIDKFEVTGSSLISRGYYFGVVYQI